jgi:hypothetical protein
MAKRQLLKIVSPGHAGVLPGASRANNCVIFSQHCEVIDGFYVDSGLGLVDWPN